MFIIAGSWVDRLEEFSQLLNAGADVMTKFPAIKLFGSERAKEIENQAKLANREFIGTLTKLPEIDWDNEVDKLDIDDELKDEVKIKLNQYLQKMK